VFVLDREAGQTVIITTYEPNTAEESIYAKHK